MAGRALREELRVDTRALAAMRVLLGLAILGDLFLRAPELVAFHTDAGAAPRALVLEHHLWAAASLHMLSGGAAWQGVLFVLAAVAACALIVGYRTRTAAIASFVLLVSLQARNPWVLNSGDTTLTLLLFWSMFLPLGAHASVDGSRAAWQVRGAAATALLIQAPLIYAANAVAKTRAGVWLDGEALQYVFVDTFTTPVGAWIARSDALLSALTWSWLALVWAAVLLPVLQGRARGLLALALIAAHAAMAVTMRIGVFPLVSIAALLPFLPAAWWDALQRRWPRGRPVAAAAAAATAAPAMRRHRDVAVAACLAALVSWSAAGAALPDSPMDTWAMFSDPPRAPTWYHAIGNTSAGPVDAFTQEPPTWRPPQGFGDHWRKLLGRLREPLGDRLQEPLMEHLCARVDVQELTLWRVTDRGAGLDAHPVATVACR